ncbi:RHS repeat domain-containing protein [Saprospira grandis]|uniref:YD repeat protein n=1 Tax=Saprospira grandis (strain Lewin) TaxID=984262 RepID=H6L0G9_SAPGL|nr:RHS repeat-associated core domain-containing protein [Saprospira grandis]AFC23399.1 YD repeat protein [Saprospira grandis str. Lewin]
MVRDSSEQIEEIVWNVEGKVQEVHFEAGKPGPSILQYEYDPMGNRLAKKKLYVDGPVDIRSEGQYYVRDPQGNVLAVYQFNEADIAVVGDRDSLYLEELHLYGSACLGILKKALALRYRDESGTANWSIRTLAKTALAQSSYQQLELGRRRYELSNHLGNVLATVSDKSLGQDSSQTGQADYYLAQVFSASLYYPFGWEMPGRKFVSGEGYRFGFNGKEGNPEIADGNLDFGARNYDGRIGRWWSVDPLQSKYPGMSPYNGIGNNPIIYVDPDGKDIVVTIRDVKNAKGTVIRRIVDVEVNVAVVNLSRKGDYEYQSGSINLSSMNDKKVFSTKLNERVNYRYTTQDGIKNRLTDDKVPIDINVSVNVRSVNSISEIKDGENIAIIVDDITGDKDGGITQGRAKMYSDIMLLEADIDRGRLKEVFLHELGHNLGLEFGYNEPHTLDGKGLMGSHVNGDLSIDSKAKRDLWIVNGVLTEYPKKVYKHEGTKERAKDFLKRYGKYQNSKAKTKGFN